MSAASEMLDPARRAFETALNDEGWRGFSEAVAGPEALNDDDLSGIISSEIRHSVNEETSLIAARQQEADRFYRGDPFGNEIKGRSRVVTHDLAETIDWMMPVLMRMFFYTNRIVRYSDTTPESEQLGIGAQATRQINPLFREHLHGFRVTHDWIKSALLYKVGVLKCWVEKVREPQFKWLLLDIEEIYALIEAESEDLQIVSVSEEPVEEPGPPVLGPDGQPMPGPPVQKWQVRVKQWQKAQKIRLEAVAPEEFLISRRCRVLDDDTPFSCHKRPVTKGELASMGISWADLDGLSTYADDFDGRLETREEDEITTYGDTAYRPDEASQKVMVWESYVRVDYDGDGYAELRKVWAAGNESRPTILAHEIVDCNPLIAIIPKPMPHKFYGRSVFDDIEDLQKIRSTLMRCMLDNLYLTNAPRMWAMEGEVDIDRLLEAIPGGVVPVTMPGGQALGPIETAPLSSWVMEALNYTQEMRENRTGVSRISSATLADSQNQTAMGVAQVFEAAEARISLVAQMIAETGMRDLFRKIPRILKGASLAPMMLKIGEQWVPFDPAAWPERLDCTIEVGLSPGQTEQRIQRLLMILGLQEKAMGMLGPGFLTNYDKIYAVLAKIVEEAGIASPEIAFTDPKGSQPPPQPPPMEKVEAEAKIVNEKQKTAINAAKLEEKAEYDKRTLDIRQQDMLLKDQRERLRMEADERVRMMQIEVNAQIELKRMEAQLEQARIGAAARKEGAESPGGASDGQSG